MLNPAKKGPGGVAILIGGGGKPPGPSEGGDDAGDTDVIGEGKKAAGSLFRALKAGDEAGFMSAFDNCMTAYGVGEDSDEQEPDADDQAGQGGKSKGY
jgi:hypothetical protein